MKEESKGPQKREEEDRYDDLVKVFPRKNNFLEEYKIEKKPIGQGGQGKVFKAIMKKNEIPVAVKKGHFKLIDVVSNDLDLHFIEREVCLF